MCVWGGGGGGGVEQPILIPDPTLSAMVNCLQAIDGLHHHHQRKDKVEPATAKLRVGG